MNSKQLQYFLTTVHKGSIASAAREMDIAQPAVSQQLATLEREMGAKLLDRSFSGVSLTPAGEVFFSHATNLIEAMNLAKSAMQPFGAQKTGVVKVAMLPSIGNVLSMPLIEEVNQQGAKLKLEISTGPSYSVKGWLESKQVDIALTYEQDIDSRFMTVTPLINEDLHLVYSPNAISEEYDVLHGREQIAFWELSELPLLSPGTKDALGKLIAQYETSTGVSLKHDKAYSGQLMTGLRQVMQGEGVMILPSSAVFHLEEAGLLKSIKIVEPQMQRLVIAATNKTSPLSDSVLRMLRIIQTTVKKEQALTHWRGSLSAMNTASMSGLATG